MNNDKFCCDCLCYKNINNKCKNSMFYYKTPIGYEFSNCNENNRNYDCEGYITEKDFEIYKDCVYFKNLDIFDFPDMYKCEKTHNINVYGYKFCKENCEFYKKKLTQRIKEYFGKFSIFK